MGWRDVGMELFRQKMKDWLKRLEDHGDILRLKNRKERVAVVAPVKSEAWIRAGQAIPEELLSAHVEAWRRHPVQTGVVIRSLAGADEGQADRIARVAAEEIAKTPEKSAPPSVPPRPLEQLNLPMRALGLVPGSGEEAAMQLKFAKPSTGKKPQPQKVGCSCDSPTGALVSRGQIDIYKPYEDRPETWKGEPWEQRTLRCRDCGWEVTFTRRGDGYKVDFKRQESDRPKLRRLLLVEELAAEADAPR
jgi:hypothetical protein